MARVSFYPMILCNSWYASSGGKLRQPSALQRPPPDSCKLLPGSQRLKNASRLYLCLLCPAVLSRPDSCFERGVTKAFSLLRGVKSNRPDKPGFPIKVHGSSCFPKKSLCFFLYSIESFAGRQFSVTVLPIVLKSDA